MAEAITCEQALAYIVIEDSLDHDRTTSLACHLAGCQNCSRSWDAALRERIGAIPYKPQAPESVPCDNPSE